jgi:hypothetical protein
VEVVAAGVAEEDTVIAEASVAEEVAIEVDTAIVVDEVVVVAHHSGNLDFKLFK